MTSSTVVLLISAAYLLISLVVGMWPSGGDTSSDAARGYVAGDRSLGLVVMYFITGATIFSSFAFLGAPGMAYDLGAGAFYILGYGALGFVPFYFLGPRAARVGRKFGFVTQAEMIAHRFSTVAKMKETNEKFREMLQQAQKDLADATRDAQTPGDEA